MTKLIRISFLFLATACLQSATCLAMGRSLEQGVYGQPVPDLNTSAGVNAEGLNGPNYDIFRGVSARYEAFTPELIHDEEQSSRVYDMTDEEQEQADLQDGLPPPSYYERNPQPDTEQAPPDVPTTLPDKPGDPTEAPEVSPETGADLGSPSDNGTDPGDGDGDDN